MKTVKFIFILFLTFLTGLVSAQTTIAQWTFENPAKRALITDSATFITNPYTADSGTVANINIAPITLVGARFPVATSSQWVSGSGGTGTFAPNGENWLNGTNTKYWMVTISTVGYHTLKLNSKQRSSSTGPRDFKAQYSTNGTVWTDIPGASVVCATTFGTSGNITNINLPAACENQSALRIRWTMTSEIAVNAGPVASAGTSRIDDIQITGTAGVVVNSAVISPNNATFNINNQQVIKTVITWNDASSLTRIVNSKIPPDTLIPAVNYILTADTVTISTSYLQSQYTSAGQQHMLYFVFNAGNPAVLTITWANDSIYNAVINPVTANYDLTIPGNISTNITWNSASGIVQIQDNQTSPHILLPSEYTVVGNTLTIQQSYLASVLTSSGQSVQLDIDFNAGNNAIFTINSIISPPQPDIIASWNFENATKRALITDHASFVSSPYTADLGITANQNISPISLAGGNTFSAWVTGSGGTGTFAPNSTAWNAGALTKYWMIKVSTENYGSLSLSSKQRSSAGGPANFVVEYSIDGINWLSIPGSAVVCAENFTSGVLVDLPLPLECNNNPSLWLRWKMTSNTAVNGSEVTTTGTNRIDDIVIRGQLITSEANIVGFSFPEQAGPAFIDNTLQNITIEVLYGTDPATLTASFVLSPNATTTVNGVPQISGLTQNDFTNVVTYAVTSGDGLTTKFWNVFVNVAPPNNEAEITDFSIQGHQTNMIDINSIAGTVDIEILGSSLLNLIAEFELSYGATAEIAGVPQQSGVTVNNFTGPVIYTIIAEDGTTQRNWTVNVTFFDNIDEGSNMNSVRVYPNPSEGMFNIELQQQGVLQIYSNSGQLIYSAEQTEGNHSISTDNALPGLYFVKFISGERSYNIPIVIQK